MPRERLGEEAWTDRLVEASIHLVEWRRKKRLGLDVPSEIIQNAQNDVHAAVVGILRDRRSRGDRSAADVLDLLPKWSVPTEAERLAPNTPQPRAADFGPVRGRLGSL